ncbi:MAG: indole-3-glycerol phosphate synthase TrpC [Rhodospirillales bacterium]|nr:indole-3-glycerol phosphate synthase TrpC [Rhodospirillales bacterium]
MSDVLTKICDDKRVHVAKCKEHTSLNDVEAKAKEASTPRGFSASLERSIADGRYGLIAEVKKASPSKGLIRADFNPTQLAQAYERGGASCISVLTDVPYFQGADSYLVEARSAVNLPILRKDFMVDPYQIVEARALGADCILLIMAALDDNLAKELEDTAIQYGMDVLVEVHDAEELERAHKLQSPLLGVNNRNLKTLEVSLTATEKLAPLVAKDRYIVCESGLNTPEDLARMSKIGAERFLVGESLMRQDNVEEATRTLIAKG